MASARVVLPATRRADEQHAVAGLKSVGAQQVRALLLFNQLVYSAAHNCRQDEIVQTAPGHDLRHEFPTARPKESVLHGGHRDRAVRGFPAVPTG